MKLLVLGIDALDRILLGQFIDEMPNFAGLIDQGILLPVVSTFPPDSDTAWATIYTGMNPAEHGIVRFIDPLEKSYKIQYERVDNTVLQGNTIFDVLNKNEIRAHAIFPHLCYPVWDTGGILVSRATDMLDVQANPPEVLDMYPNASIIAGVRGFPDRSRGGMKSFIERHKRQAFADAEFAINVMQNFEWDLVFVYWSTLDAISHFFWSHHDKDDPLYDPGNEFEDTIRSAYGWFDILLGRFLEEVDDHTSIIVMSDHGHGGRPATLVNVNEMLRKIGLLIAHNPDESLQVSFVEFIKRTGMKAVSAFGLAKLAGKVLRVAPGIMKFYTRPQIIDWNNTVAYVSDMSGIKAYTYGGVCINRGTLSGIEYERIRDRIIDYLPSVCKHPEDGTRLIKLIARREDVYRGVNIGEYPDIVLEFEYGYGLGWEVFSPLFVNAISHKIVPGSHRGDTGVFISQDSKWAEGKEVNLLSLKSLVLHHFGIAA
ncbi:MAG: hypothetical protein GTO14_22810 [Anaerolineales bacterium]|nr:hypothetical protein [Anaerolineales bacterium]